jgi:FixJ family two-component response regulator
MGLSDVLPRLNGTAPIRVPNPDVVVLEDDPQLAAMAVELCERAGLTAETYSSPAAFLDDALVGPPHLLILDWRFERELGAAVFMAARHRFGDVPIVCWTASAVDDLPAMVVDDPRVRFVAKSDGADAFDAAVRWAAESQGGRFR